MPVPDLDEVLESVSELLTNTAVSVRHGDKSVQNRSASELTEVIRTARSLSGTRTVIRALPRRSRL